jgi:hypothetical protein
VERKIATHYIQPGKPMQNGYRNGTRVCPELLIFPVRLSR